MADATHRNEDAVDTWNVIMSDHLSSLAYLNGKPKAQGKLKMKHEDFCVSENLSFEPSGDGEHLMLRIRKTGENTSFVANELAKACGVKSRDVSWAGLKDRHAVTEQWFSIYLPKSESPDFSLFLSRYPQIEILKTTRHHKKIRPGDLDGNEFKVVISEVTDVEDVLQRLEKISRGGVPNYFGNQRFGHGGNNLVEARRWGRENVRTRNAQKRSLYLSAARSWIFNTIVSARVKKEILNLALLGDIVERNQELVLVTKENIEIVNHDLVRGVGRVTAAMAGDNSLPTESDALNLEQPFLDAETDLMSLIRGNRMQHDRRSCILIPQDMQWSTDKDSVTLQFSLTSGSFATSVVRELVNEIEVERTYK